MHFVSDSLTLTYLASLRSLILTEDAGTAASCQVRDRERPRPDRRQPFNNLAPEAIERCESEVRVTGRRQHFQIQIHLRMALCFDEWFLQPCNLYFGMLAYLFVCFFFRKMKLGRGKIKQRSLKS